jgi:hypothetical protein
MIFQALSKCQYSQGHHRLKRGFSKPDQLITFLIGKADDIKPFLVHKETVCHYSPILCTMDSSPEIRTRLSQRCGGETTGQRGDPDCACGGHLACKNQTESLVQLWILAEKLLVPQLQNRVIDVLCRLNKRCRYTPENYDLVYSETFEGHPLRRFIIDQALWREIPDYNANFRAELPHDMAVDMLRKLFGMSDEQIDINRKKWPVMEAEDYYVNGSRTLLCE